MGRLQRESCRRWDCSGGHLGEWTDEGEQNGFDDFDGLVWETGSDRDIG
ncbi:MAG: hypothetical protein IKJ77_03735 [Firmicutes bacterium]|nr:hypothetical protein [Bacillota bacterium]